MFCSKRQAAQVRADQHVQLFAAVSHLFVFAADLECCVNVISHLVPRLPPHQVRSAAKQIADALVATVSSCLLNCLLLRPCKTVPAVLQQSEVGPVAASMSDVAACLRSMSKRSRDCKVLPSFTMLLMMLKHSTCCCGWP